MKFLNDFKNVFAIVGVVSIIFWTCATDSTSDDNSSNLPPQLTGGTYQVENVAFGSSGSTNPVSASWISVLNTETGVMKTYFKNSGTSYLWQEAQGTGGLDTTITFTH